MEKSDFEIKYLGMRFVAVGGIEPPTFGTDFQQPLVMLYQLSYTAFHIYLSEVRLMQVPNPA